MEYLRRSVGDGGCWAGRDVMVGLEGKTDGGTRTWIQVWIFIRRCREFFLIVFCFGIGLD